MADQDLEHILRRMSQTRVNRRGFMAGGAMAGMAAFIAACSGSKASDAPASVAAPSTAAGVGRSVGGRGRLGGSRPFSQEPTEGQLWMYNWSDYIDPGNIEEFKKRYAIDDGPTTPTRRTRSC